MLLELIIVIITFVVVIAGYITYYKKKKHLPKGYVKVGNVEPVKRSKSADITRDGYIKKKVPEDIDVIVIGSGIGSLATAGFLAKIGKKVLVLEQHYVVGGCMHEFEDKKFEWDTGIHYVGRIKKYGKILDIISDPEYKVEWRKMGTEEDGYVYDEIQLGNTKRHKYRAGEDNFINDLVERFPEEEEAIREYVKLVKHVNKSSSIAFESKIIRPTWLRNLVRKFMTKKFDHYANQKPLDVIQSITDNKELQGILMGQFGDYGDFINASFFIHCGVVAHYLEGGYYPIGGTQGIARAIIPTIEKSGGRVLVRAEVNKILIDLETNQAYGVEMKKDGHQIYAPQIVSGCGIYTTFKKLLYEEVKDHYGDKRLPQLMTCERVKPSVGHICCFVGLEGTPDELDLPSSNLWVLPCDDSFDLVEMTNNYYNDPYNTEDMLLFISFSCSKDPKWSESHPDISTACIITEARAEWFETWKNQKSGSRDEEYQELKSYFQEKMINGLFKYFPQLEGKVVYSDVSTPLSTEFYLNNVHGSSYGISPSPERFTGVGKESLFPETCIDGLYLTGQDTVSAGFAGAFMSGVLTSMAMTNYGTLLDIIGNRNIVTDILNIPKEK